MLYFARALLSGSVRSPGYAGWLTPRWTVARRHARSQSVEPKPELTWCSLRCVRLRSTDIVRRGASQPAYPGPAEAKEETLDRAESMRRGIVRAFLRIATPMLELTRRTSGRPMLHAELNGRRDRETGAAVTKPNRRDGASQHCFRSGAQRGVFSFRHRVCVLHLPEAHCPERILQP